MRYVILHHTGWIEDHFDLMLEVDDASPLQTWRLNCWPGPTSIAPLPPHRRVYLQYQGPVSNNRGQVRQVAAGEYAVAAESSSELSIVLLDRRMPIALPKRDGRPT